MRYTLLAFLCVITIIAYIQRSALSVPSKQIEAELAMTPQNMGTVWLVWYTGYALFQLPAGWVVHRLGSKPALIGFAVTWSALTALVGAATGFASLTVLWGLMGIAQSGIFVCAAKAVGATFPNTERAFASGALQCCMAGGAALSVSVTGQLLGALTWQEILAVYAIPGLVWAIVFALAVPRPEGPVLAPVVPAGTPPAPVEWSRLLTDRQMVLLCAQQLQRAGAVALLFTWFPRYLQEAQGLSVTESGRLAAWPLLAGIPGALLGGVASDRLLRRTGHDRLSRPGLAGAGTAVCAAASFAAFYAADATTAVALVCVAAFCAYASGGIAYAVAIAMGGKQVAPVFATMNMAGNVGAALFPYAVGQVVGETGKWNVTMLLFAGMFVGSTVCWALLNPKGPLFETQRPRAD